MNLKKIRVCIYLIILITLTGCRRAQANEDTLSEKTTQTLGTIISGQAYGDNSQEALELAFKKVRDIDNKMSRHKEDSQVSLINQNSKEGPVPVDEDTYKVIETSLAYAKKSQGAFNPLLGQVIEAWGIGTEDARIPKEDELQVLLENISLDNITLSKDPYTALLTKNNIKLDLGAIAKGYAADEMVKILKEEGITSALLNLGGNIIVIGDKEDGKPWTIGIQNPLYEDRGELAAIINITDTSAVTSGSYERFFVEGGIRYHHILDPSTGYPSDSDVISSTIITPNSMAADALSTAIYVLGKDKGLELIESLENTEAIIITKDKQIITSSGVKSSDINIKSKDFKYEKK